MSRTQRRSILLETRRLILRAFEEKDLPAFIAYRSDPEVAGYQSWEAPYPEKWARGFLAELQRTQPGTPGEWCQVALELKETGETIGDLAFRVLRGEREQAEAGFTIARRHQRKGYATEAVTRLFDYLFVELELHRVRANCDADNEASWRLMERVGMRREAHFVESAWFKGRWSSEYWYAMLRSEWLSRSGNRQT